MKLQLTKTQERRTDDGKWVVTVTAHLLDKSNNSKSGEELAYYADGKLVGDNVTTDDLGIASKDLTLDAGRHTVSVYLLPSGSFYRETTVNLKQDATVPADLELDPSGKDGEYWVLITALSSRGIGMKGKKILVQRSDKRGFKTLRTGEDGTRRWQIRFDSEAIDVTARIAGAPVSRKIRLYGKRAQLAEDVKTGGETCLV